MSLPGKYLLTFAVLFAVAGCVPTYTLVKPESAKVAGVLSVQPNTSWNKIPKTPGAIKNEEHWTKNGPLLDSLAFVGALPDGQALVIQKKKADRQVPAFKASMSPSDLVAMVESYYRIKGGIDTFQVVSVAPTRFLGPSGIRLDFTYVGADQLPRRGRCVMEVVDQKFYLISLEGAQSHYFEALEPEFEKIVGSARIL